MTENLTHEPWCINRISMGRIFVGLDRAAVKIERGLTDQGHRLLVNLQRFDVRCECSVVCFGAHGRILPCALRHTATCDHSSSIIERASSRAPSSESNGPKGSLSGKPPGKQAQ